MIRAVLFGHGRMGRLVGLHAAEHGVEVVGVLTSASVDETWTTAAQASADVVIDFATGEALRGNLERLSTLAPTLVLGSAGVSDLRCGWAMKSSQLVLPVSCISAPRSSTLRNSRTLPGHS